MAGRKAASYYPKQADVGSKSNEYQSTVLRLLVREESCFPLNRLGIIRYLSGVAESE